MKVKQIKTILAPTDFSAPATAGVEYATQLARRLGAKLVVLNVVQPITYMYPVDLYGYLPNTGLLLSEQRQSAKKHLAKLVTQLHKRKLKVETVLSIGNPSEGIGAAARKLRADLIVMATHGHTGLSHMLLGSVAEKVVRTATCPVLTVRVPTRTRRRRKR